MPSNTKYCVYCGNPLKSTDKFCIICGKPVLRDLPKSSKEDKVRVEEKRTSVTQPKKQVTVQDILEEEEIESDVVEERFEVEETKKKGKKRKKEKQSIEKPLPFEVKEQIEQQALTEVLENSNNDIYDIPEEYKRKIVGLVVEQKLPLLVATFLIGKELGKKEK